MTRRLLAILVAAAVAAGAASVARADGDPASEVLYFQDVYLPYAKPSADVAAGLTGAVSAANNAGFRIKVAVIQSEQDLGSVPSLFGHQDIYARFLGAELKTFYSQRLLSSCPQASGSTTTASRRTPRRRRSPASRSRRTRPTT